MRHHAANAGLPRIRGAVVRSLAAAILLKPFPPSTTDRRILLSDWGEAQGNVDIGKHLAYGPPKFRAVILRSGQGHSKIYDDIKFNQNVQICEANDFPWMVYHVLLPNQDVPRQVGHLSNLLRVAGGTCRYAWWDVQLKNGQTKRRISDATIAALVRTPGETGIDAGVYSAQWFTDGFMETQDWFSDIIWWIAQWLWPNQKKEHPWPTALPKNVDISQVMMQQTTSWGDGKLSGMGSKRLDLDRWMWTEQKLNEIMGTEPPPPTHDHSKEIAMIDDIMGRLNAVKEAL